MVTTCEDGFLLRVGVAELLPSMVISNDKLYQSLFVKVNATSLQAHPLANCYQHLPCYQLIFNTLCT